LGAVGFLVEDQFEFVLKEVVAGLHLELAEGRSNQRIQSDGQSIVKHMWYNIGKHLTVDLDARVSIDLYKPALESLIYHNIDPKDLEIVASPLRINKRI
jgi:hypothetical protein